MRRGKEKVGKREPALHPFLQRKGREGGGGNTLPATPWKEREESAFYSEKKGDMGGRGRIVGTPGPRGKKKKKKRGGKGRLVSFPGKEGQRHLSEGGIHKEIASVNFSKRGGERKKKEKKKSLKAEKTSNKAFTESGKRGEKGHEAAEIFSGARKKKKGKRKMRRKVPRNGKKKWHAAPQQVGKTDEGRGKRSHQRHAFRGRENVPA